VEGFADMIGSRLGKCPNLGVGAQPAFIFDKRYELGSIAQSEAGKEPESAEYSAFLADFKAVVWLTYRKNFTPMKPPSSFTTDTGWGCMLRSAQMLLAQVLVRHLGKGEWGRCFPVASDAHRNLLRWFLDAPKYFAFYSIHRMTECGRQYGKEPGEWYGPTTVALVLRDLVASHRQRHSSAEETNDQQIRQPKFLHKDYYSLCAEDGQDISVLVTDDGTLYLDEAFAVCCDANNKNNETTAKDDGDDDPLLRPKKELEWKSSLFLIVPVRLGLNEMNEGYVKPLIKALKFPQCVGMIGGKPAHSLYFFGSQGENFIYLDPHTVQPAATNNQCDDEFFPYQDIVSTYHCSTPRLVPAASIDPSVAIGFFCKNPSELSDLVARLRQLESLGYPFMGITQTRPCYEDEYSDDDSALMSDKQKPVNSDVEDEGMETASESGERANSDDLDGEEDDDFVLL